MNLLDLCDDGPAPAADRALRPRAGHVHEWIDTVTVWPGETTERLTITCVECGEIRGRA